MLSRNLILLVCCTFVFTGCAGGGPGSSNPVPSKAIKLAADLGCTLNTAPVKTIDKCSIKRTHGGQTESESVSVGGTNYRVMASPQTFEKVYLYSCTDSCGNPATFVGEAAWDCAGKQEPSGIAMDGPDIARSATGSCAKDGGINTVKLQDTFDRYIKDQYGDTGRPTDMPAANTGIEYWDGDSK